MGDTTRSFALFSPSRQEEKPRGGRFPDVFGDDDVLVGRDLDALLVRKRAAPVNPGHAIREKPKRGVADFTMQRPFRA